LNNIHDRSRRHGIAEAVAIENLVAIDEDGHMMTELALVIHDVSAGLFVQPEIPIQHITKRPARYVASRARDVSLNVLRKPHSCHVAIRLSLGAY
jgi:hypothetical protein